MVRRRLAGAVLLGFASLAGVAEGEERLKHTPPQCASPKRFPLIEVEWPGGELDANIQVLFRADDRNEYRVALRRDRRSFSASLPRPNPDTQKLRYRIEAIGERGDLHRVPEEGDQPIDVLDDCREGTEQPRGPLVVFEGGAPAFPIGFSGSGISAEEKDLRTHVLLADKSTVLFGTPTELRPDEALVLETQLAPHLLIVENKPSIRDAYFGGNSWSLWAIPLIRLKIFNTTSSPVRTPSFMPKVVFQFSHLGRRTEGRQWTSPRSWGIKAEVGHHSNGQDGCIFGGPRAGENCTTTPAAGDLEALRRAQVNVRDGSFSTNYERVTVYRSWLHLSEKTMPATPTYRRVSRVVTAAASYEVHGFFLGKALDTATGGLGELRPLYGTQRLKVGLELEKRRELGGSWFATRRWSVAGSAQYILNRSLTSLTCGENCANDWTLAVDATWTPRILGDVGLYARFFRGQDYYNLGFERRTTRVQLGLAFEPGRFDIMKAPVLDRTCLDRETKATVKARDYCPPATTGTTPP